MKTNIAVVLALALALVECSDAADTPDTSSTASRTSSDAVSLPGLTEPPFDSVSLAGLTCTALMVGFASPANHGVLAYVSTYGLPAGRITVHLELPPTPGSDLPYTPVGEHDDVDVDQAVALIAAHLALAH